MNGFARMTTNGVAKYVNVAYIKSITVEDVNLKIIVEHVDGIYVIDDPLEIHSITVEAGIQPYLQFYEGRE